MDGSQDRSTAAFGRVILFNEHMDEHLIGWDIQRDKSDEPLLAQKEWM